MPSCTVKVHLSLSLRLRLWLSGVLTSLGTWVFGLGVRVLNECR